MLTTRVRLSLLLWLVLSSHALAADQEPSPSWQVQLSARETLLARGTKGEETFFLRDIQTGQEQPVTELNRWYTHWNHDHLTFSPDGRWALWRDTQGSLNVTSLHGERKHLAWEDHGTLYDALRWQADSRHFVEMADPRSQGKWSPNYQQAFDRPAPGKRVGRYLSDKEAGRLEKQEKPAGGTK